MALIAQREMPDAYKDSRLLSTEEAQKLLGVSRGTLYALINNKKNPIPTFKIGHFRKFKLDKLLWWIDKQEQ
jgi:excisionase family DNA binding protein